MILYNNGFLRFLYRKTNTTLFGTVCRQVNFLIFLLVACPNYGQVLPKKAVTAADYHLWGTLYADKISEKGNWISFTMRYDESPDTLFVKRSDGNKQFAFAKSNSGTFNGEHAFVCCDTDGRLSILDLDEGKISIIEEVETYSFSGNGTYLIAATGKANQRILQVRNKAGVIVHSIAGVDQFRMNRAKDALVCTLENEGVYQVVQLTFGVTIGKSVLAESRNGKFSQLIWNADGQAVAFLRENRDATTGINRPVVCYFSPKHSTLFQVGNDSIPKGYYVESESASGLTVSPDGKRVFFTIRKEVALAEKFGGVQVWNGNDAVVYSERQSVADVEYNTRTAVWWPERDRFMIITDQSKPFGFMNASQDFAISYSTNDLAPQYKLDRNVNYSVTDLETGQRNLLLENQSTELSASSLSPGGNYFAYFKDNNWWVYNFLNGAHSNVTGRHGLQLADCEDKIWPGNYRVAGWGMDDASILLYDPFDIWQIDLKVNTAVRLTRGRETGISYRIVPPVSNEFNASYFTGHIDEAVDVNNKILLSATRINESGYFIYETNRSLKPIVFGDFLTTKILKASKSDVYVFESQRYSSPPKLDISKGKEGRNTTIYQSNLHHYGYAWGKSEKIYYQNSKNELLTGILYYPAVYNPEKKYPMVVHVYESQSYLYHCYINPSLHNMSGFNPSNLTAQGYFVLLPDIEYELGNPGLSALDCVLAATKAVVNTGLIDSTKIGLIGHSFGGYETNFILGQTDLFACAISGASVFDLAGWYLSIGWNVGRPEMWRFESQQWRMGKSLFEDRKGYERNSPLNFVDRIKTPVLIWTGEEDRQIHYYQSIAFYLAMQRLKKKAILFVYPGDGHALVKKDNQEHFAQRIEDWFGYYLKGESPKKWIREGVQ